MILYDSIAFSNKNMHLNMTLEFSTNGSCVFHANFILGCHKSFATPISKFFPAQ